MSCLLLMCEWWVKLLKTVRTVCLLFMFALNDGLNFLKQWEQCALKFQSAFLFYPLGLTWKYVSTWTDTWNTAGQRKNVVEFCWKFHPLGIDLGWVGWWLHPPFTESKPHKKGVKAAAGQWSTKQQQWQNEDALWLWGESVGIRDTLSFETGDTKQKSSLCS